MSRDVATAIVEVAVDPPTAFEVFTEEVAAWWRASESLRFEAGVGGRVLALTGGKVAEPVEIGRILVWEPGPRLAFSYRGDTEVEVRYDKEQVVAGMAGASALREVPDRGPARDRRRPDRGCAHRTRHRPTRRRRRAPITDHEQHVRAEGGRLEARLPPVDSTLRPREPGEAHGR